MKIIFQNLIPCLNLSISRVGENLLTFGLLKRLFSTTIERMEAIIASATPFNALIDEASDMANSDLARSAIAKIEGRFLKINTKARVSRLDNLSVKVVSATKKKFVKDFNIIKDFPIPDEKRVCSSNRAIGNRI